MKKFIPLDILFILAFVSTCVVELYWIYAENALTIGIASTAISILIALPTFYFSLIRPNFALPEFKVDINVDAPKENTPDPSWFYRLKISIDGRSAIDRCVGRMLRIVDNNQEPLSFDPLYFFWPRQDNKKDNGNFIYPFSPIALHGEGDYQYLDIAQYKRYDNGDEKLILRVLREGQALKEGESLGEGVGIQPGTYFIEVGLFGDGAKSKRVWVSLKMNDNEVIKEKPFELELHYRRPK